MNIVFFLILFTMISMTNAKFFRKAKRPFSALSEIKSLVICGPSGVGKGTLINKLLNEYKDSIGFSVSYTSRKPRPGEIDGVHYHFITKDDFEKDIKSGKYKYWEHACVHSNLYGTREDAVNSVHKAGKVCILDVDVRGVKQLKENKFPAKYLFITPISMSNLENQLRNRGTETEEQVIERIKNAKAEIDYGNNTQHFDYILINRDVDDSYKKLVDKVTEWFPFVKKQ